MKKIILSIALLVLLVGCGKTNKNSNAAQKTGDATQEKKHYYSYLDHLDKKGMQTSSIAFDSLYDIKNPEELKKHADNIFIGRILSLNKSDSPSNEKKDENVVAIPYTYGQLEVYKNISGKLPEKIDFFRLGGIMKEKDLYRYEHKEVVNKLNEDRKKNGKPLVEESNQLIETLAEGDFHLTAGQVYLFYAEWDNYFGRLLLIGYGDGALPLEEENQPIEKVGLAKDEIGKSWKIKNKRTGKKEVLSEYLEKRAKIKVKKK